MPVYICFPVFSPFSAHFYPPLHHNGKGSILGCACIVSLTPCLTMLLLAAVAAVAPLADDDVGVLACWG